MSLRDEQYRAIKRARDYVQSRFEWWVAVRNRVWPIKPLRNWAQTHVNMAYRCLRHFPTLCETGQPMWSKDEFTKDL